MNYLLMAQPAQGAQPNPIMTFLPLILIIVVFYFLHDPSANETAERTSHFSQQPRKRR